MKSIAIITARAGSKRIPKKNIKDFCGKPIIAYSIKAALEADVFDEVMVSTDSEEIANISLEYGATVPFFRSEATSNDYATTGDVILEVLDEYEKRGKTFDVVCCLYPTAPFVRPERLVEGINIISDGETESVSAVVKFSFPPQRSFIIANDFLVFNQPEHVRTRSQDLQPMYHDAGQYYFATVKAIREYKSFTTIKNKPIILSDEEVQDIDNIEDWEIAEFKYQFMLKNRGKNEHIQ